MPLGLGLVLGSLALVSPPPPPDTVGVSNADSCQGDVACSKYAGGHPVPVTTYTGAPGVISKVSVTREDGRFVFRVTDGLIRAEAPCETLDPTTARCPVTEGEGGIPGLAMGLGDRDDAVTVAGDLAVNVQLAGGDGDDTLTGADGNEEMDGGAGNDVLRPGIGFDVLSYAGRTGPVGVDLVAGSGGELGEGDVLGAGFETVLGGSGDDGLRGTTGVQILDGGEGDDQLSGGGGADELFGGVGTDRIFGGPGNDRLFGDPQQGDDYYTPSFRFGDDHLSGGTGDDHLFDTGGRNHYFGGPGDDTLEGGEDGDRAYGGAGRDWLYMAGGGRDRVNCGPGRDRASRDRADRRRGCERPLRPRE